VLTYLKLDNFKIWRSTGAMRLAPLTLLLGTNSSGKSSLIQSLLLIRQTVKGDDPNLDLNLGNPDTGDSVTLGQFKDLLCRHGAASASNPANQVGIEFRWRDTATSSHSTLFSARYRKGASGSAELDYLRLGQDGQGFTVQRRKPGIYRLQLAHERKPLGQSANYRPQRSFTFSPAAITVLGGRGEALKDIGPALLDELSKIIYLGPVRRLAQRDYVWAGRMPAHIGDDGAKAVDALIASGVAIQLARKRKQPQPPEAALFTQTIYWLKAMNLADGLAVRSLGNSARYELLIENNGEQSNLKDVGVGVSQVLPVIVAALFAEPGHIVIVEEPESHLHPLAQSELANLFAAVSKQRGVQFIVETHSEHLFRRMQTLIAKREISKGNCAMYFVARENQMAILRPLQIDEFGTVMNWPSGFFGDAIGEAREQARARIVTDSQAQADKS
jgi:predicted ATPase